MSDNFQHDILVIGAGSAGLSLALHLAEHARVALLCKQELTESASLYAQGGIAAVLDEIEDSIDAHIADTLNAGAGLSDPTVVRFTVENAKSAIQWLIKQGVAFTQEKRADGQLEYHLTREGGHNFRRIIHAADATGQALQTTLASRARNHPNITIFEYCTAIDLIIQQQRCAGAYVLMSDQRVACFQARFVVLATGGASKVYFYTTNPDISSGDGIAMASRAGCRVANMEFNQFHPTCLYHPEAKSFLISEALRGEGAHLLLPDGTRFMPQFDPRAELAPRDIVARAIDHQMKRYGLDYVHLDISHKPRDFILSHFPTIYARCLEYGIDITRSPIPVVPAAHYTCGGVMTNLQGRTDIPGLYAIGETAFTGLHGANRMASNSLLECIVFAKSASDDIEKLLSQTPMPSPAPAWDESRVIDSDEEIVVSHNWDELRRLMWDYVGIVRTNKRLQRAKNRIDLLKQEIQAYYSGFRVTRDLIELRNLILVADLIVRSALSRHESRGLHYSLDYPGLNLESENTII